MNVAWETRLLDLQPAQRRPRGRWRRFLWTSTVAAMSISAARADVVHLRGGIPAIEGQITRIDEAGVAIKREFAQPDFIRWDLIRDVVKDVPDPLLDRHKESAATLWRARSRLERQDAALAEPLFERLFEKYRGQTHETALLVAEGLLRCRLARGANDGAVIPALETVRLRRAIGKSNVFATLSPMVDENTHLCMSLPPTWVMSSNLMKVERDLAGYDAGADTVVAAMAAFYRRAISQQLQIRHDENERPFAADHGGVAILRQIMAMQSSDQMVRTQAREDAMRNVAAAPDWLQAWSYYFLGISHLADGEASADRGLVALAHVPARFGRSSPYLAGLALEKLAETCDAQGDHAARDSLRQELFARYPSHPILMLSKRRTTWAHDRCLSRPQIVVFKEPT